MIHLRFMNLEKINMIDHYGLVQSLANDKQVQQYISKDFLNWLTQYQANSNERIEPKKAYAISLENRYVGVVGSLSLSDEGILEIWYAIKKNLRGRGYGNQILKEITPHLFQHLEGVREIHLKIDRDNIASRKMAMQNGYLLEEEDLELGIDTYSYKERKR